MIRNFRSRALKRFFQRGDTSRVRPDHVQTVTDILTRLNASATPDDMAVPGFHVHPLKGDYKGFWAVTVKANWRIIFRFEDGHAVDVDYLDYH